MEDGVTIPRDCSDARCRLNHAGACSHGATVATSTCRRLTDRHAPPPQPELPGIRNPTCHDCGKPRPMAAPCPCMTKKPR